MAYSLAFSPCPNDTFMFWAMLHQQIDTQGLRFDVELHDIDQLNTLAANGDFDILKLSYACYPQVSKEYQILYSGSAMGFGNGPLLISKQNIYPDEVSHLKIAIPGEYTTANMLLTIAFPNATNKKIYLFSDIEEAILSNEVDAGLLIHETRFTYQQKGLRKIMDLGEYWESETQLPLPLGAIAIRRSLNQEVKKKISAVLQESVRFALQNPSAPASYVAKHAQVMNPEVCRKHIDLYVNDFSIDVGKKGRLAVETLFERGQKAGFFQTITEPVFIA